MISFKLKIKIEKPWTGVKSRVARSEDWYVTVPMWLLKILIKLIHANIIMQDERLFDFGVVALTCTFWI